MRHALALLLISLLAPAAASARPGDLDRGFGDRGVVLGAPGPAASLVRTLPGRRTVSMWEGGALASFDARGRRIGAFPPVAADLAAPAGAGIAVLRMVADTESHVSVQRFDAAGQPVTAPVAVEHASRDEWRTEALLAGVTGTIIVGRLESRDGTEAVTVGRLTPDGTPDPRYGQYGVAVLHNRAAPAAAARPDGGVDVAAGTLRGAVRFAPLPDLHERRVGVRRGLMPVALRRTAGGRLLLAAGDWRRGEVVRLLPDGRIDRGFPRLRFDGGVTALALDHRGRILVATRERARPDSQVFATVRRFDRRGVLDVAFGRAVVGRPGWTQSRVSSLLADGAGGVLAAGSASAGATSYPLLARLDG